MDTPARFLLPTLAAALALAAGAVPPQTARLQQKFPAHGLAANVLANAAQDVPKLPSSSKWVASGGPDGKTEIVTFDPVEVWVDASRIGCWRDRQGNTLVLAEATCPAPLDAGDERFRGGAPLDAIMKAMDAFRAGWNPEDADLARWASAFSGREFKASSFTAVEHPPARLAAMKVCETSSGASCFFKFKSREPESWYWIDFTASRGLAPGDALRLVKNIAGGASRIRKTASGAPGPSGASGGAAPQADVRRESARRSISGMRGWWSDETPDYIFLSNMPSGAGRSLLQKVKRQMTPLRKAYARYVPPSHGVGTCVVRIFASLPEYREYVKDESGIPGSSSGLWSPAREELLVAGDGKNTEDALKTFRHEGFHQYLHYATACGNHAMWFNEGHACLFETAEPGGSDMRVGEGRPGKPDKNGRYVPTRAQCVESNPEAVARSLPSVIMKSNSEFYSGDVNRNYVAAWALCYFLHKAPLVAPRDFGCYAAVLPAYLEAMRSGSGSDAATAAAFDKVKGRDLPADFLLFWRKYRSRAKNAEPKPAPAARSATQTK